MKRAAGPRNASGTAPRAWQRMLSGRRLDIVDPSPLDVEIEDIAHGLARVARWNGQTAGAHAYSVAQHSVLVMTLARLTEPTLPADAQLQVLLHDAPEYVIGDLVSPFKAQLGDGYKAIERRLLAAVHLRFGLPPAAPEEIGALCKNADRQAAFLEATRLAGFGLREARAIFGAPPVQAGPWETLLAPLDAEGAKATFLEAFRRIEAQRARLAP